VESAVSTDNKVVRKIVDEALTNYGWEHDKCCGTIHDAFRSLQAYRQIPGSSLDLNYAAAEHYLFARWMVCTGTVSSTQMKVLVSAYDAKKWLDSKTGSPDTEAVTSNPVSPPNWEVMTWGLKGCDDGGSDMKRCNPGADPPLWKAVEEVLGKKTYGGSYGTNRKYGYQKG
jgi:hypothetical protein